LKADVKAFERLQIVRDWNSSFWLEVQVVYGPRKMFRSFQLALDERLVDDHLGCYVCQFTSLPCFDLLSHRLEVALHAIDTPRNAIDQRERL